MIKKILTKIFGRLNKAKRKGMIVEEGVTVMGGVDFGSEPWLITLRKNARISSNVAFITHDGGTWAFRNDNNKYKNVIKYGKIEVGEYSFVGLGSIIMPNVKIGKNCVIGAGSVVTKSVPDGMVVGGVPAKIICTTKQYAEKSLASLPVDFDNEAYKANKKEYLTKILKI